MSDLGPPGARRRRWVPPVTLALVGALVAAGLAALVGTDRTSESDVVAAYIPADGASWFGTQEIADGERTRRTTVFTETARVSGSAITGALDWTLVTRVIGALDGDEERLDRGHYWRTITREVGSRGVGAGEGVTPPAELTRVYRLDRDVTLLAESGPRGAFSYAPNLVELPVGARPGQSWQSSGTVGGAQITYTADFSARAGDAGCLEVTGTITYRLEGQNLPRAVGRTWCSDGLVAETDAFAGDRTRVATPPELRAVTTEDRPTAWDPARWTAQRLTTVSIDPTYGEGPISGTPASLPPVGTRSGLVLRAASSVHDVVALAPESGTRWRSRWRAHPGGAVLTLTALGDVAVVTTSQRQIVAYDADGVRRWQLATDEVVHAPPIRASARELGVVTLGGEVLLLDAATGAVRWRARPGSDVGVAPVAGSGVAVTADRAGQLRGLELGDGQPRWQAEVEDPVALAAAGGRLAVLSTSDVDTFDLATGERLSRSFYVGAGKSVALVGDWTVLAGSDGVRALDRTGRTAWTRGADHDLSTDSRHLVLWARGRAEVLDPAGRSLTTFPTPTAGVGNPHRFLVTADGVYLFDSTWEFSGWTGD